MHPEVVERAAKDLELLSIEVEKLSVVGLEALGDTALGKVLVQSVRGTRGRSNIFT
jgi:hypothetical protein